jgi:hypothetical protein
MERTKEQRQIEVRKIISKLTQLHLSTTHDEIKQLFKHMKTFVDDGIIVNINIEFPAMNVRIKGVLETNIKKQVWVKLECLDSDEGGESGSE